MTFQSLYRKYRPQRFSEFVGQEHVTTALRNAVREDRVGHAYLFSGPRGTGKTTTARIIAKALNCTDLQADGEPCGVCDSCVEITKGSSMDVIELDAASHNGVAEMRALLERVAFRSAGGRRRIYIVDEVHMLSKGASNALLKTLEEPPDHVVFVLCTTDPQQVLPTIRSRTQHYEFTLIPTDLLAGYMGELLQHEKVEADGEALHLIARRAGGSARDALSLLDQVLALGDGSVDAERVRALFESTPFSRQAEIVEGIAGEDAARVLVALEAVLETGVDPRQVADDLLRYLRSTFLLTATGGEVRLDALEEEREQLAAHGTALTMRGVTRAIETIGEAAVDMRKATDPRLVLEVALVRLAKRDAGPRVEVLADRLERLERAVDELRSGSPLPAAAPVPAPAPADAPAEKPTIGAMRRRQAQAAPSPATPAPQPQAEPEPPAPEPEPEAPAPTAAPAAELDLDDVVLAWPDLLGTLNARLKAMAQEAQPVAVEGGVVVLALPEQMKALKPAIEKDAERIGTALGGLLDRRPLRLKVTVQDGFAPAAPAADDVEEVVEIDDEPGPEVEVPAVDSVDRLKEAFSATLEEEPAE